MRVTIGVLPSFIFRVCPDLRAALRLEAFWFVTAQTEWAANECGHSTMPGETKKDDDVAVIAPLPNAQGMKGLEH